MQIRTLPTRPRAPVLKKVCAYARVSSGKDAMVHSLAAQVDHYSTLIRNTPGWEYAGVYADEAKTGTKDTRDDFQKMLSDCDAGKIDMIITKSVSRFARNTITLLDTVRDLKSKGIDVYFEEQNIHSISDEGELMLTLLASFAQEESLSVSENMKWRIRKKFQQGQPWDGKILGYRIKNGRYVIQPEEAETVRYIYERYLSGKGENYIANELNSMNVPTRFHRSWHGSTVGNILKNRTYTGDLLLQKTYRENHLTKKKLINNGELPKYMVTGAHEAIVDRETFDRVQEELQKRRERYRGPVATSSAYHCSYPLTGKITCGICGKSFKRKKTHAGIRWMCSTYLTRGKSHCPAKQIPEDTVMELADKLGGLECVTRITANPGNELVFEMTDGTEHTLTWKMKSRADSWTDEMKEKARKRNLCMHKKQHQEK